MTTKITRVPRGLQSVLGTQAFGKNPDELLLEVRPILDIGTYFKPDQDRWYIEGTGAINDSEGQDANQIVPDGEFWLVKRIVFSCAYQSGTPDQDTISLIARAQFLANSNSPATSIGVTNTFQYQPLTSLQTVESTFVQEYGDQELILAPGVDLQFWHCNKKGGGTFFATYAVNYIAIEV